MTGFNDFLAGNYPRVKNLLRLIAAGKLRPKGEQLPIPDPLWRACLGRLYVTCFADREQILFFLNDYLGVDTSEIMGSSEMTTTGEDLPF